MNILNILKNHFDAIQNLLKKEDKRIGIDVLFDFIGGLIAQAFFMIKKQDLCGDRELKCM